MGLILGLAAAFFFASASIALRVGQRTREYDDGLFMTVFVNLVMFGMVVPFIDVPPWSTSGVIGLTFGGVVGTVFGRFSNLRSIRLIGPTRANAFLTANPVVSAIVGWIVLNEAVGPAEGAGGALVVFGLLRFIRDRSAPPAMHPTSTPSAAGYAFAILAPTFFGIAFVIRKWGLARYDSAVMGAFIGGVAAFVAISIVYAVRRELLSTIRSNALHGSWWFVLAGVLTGAALLSQFTAFGSLPAWVVGILQGTQGIWTMGLSIVFLGAEEAIDGKVVLNVFMVALGVAVIGFAG
ncbi:MAG: DMT family transporter [Acidimicrobiia bacterium]|nr:DMT family transporter [Acidimicrobiia bacterium]